MKRRIFIIALTALIVGSIFLAVYSRESEDPNGENDETIGQGEETEGEDESSSEEEENMHEEEDSQNDASDGEANEENNEDEYEDEDEHEDEENEGSYEEDTTAGDLQKFHGLWKMEEDESVSDTMLLEIGVAKGQNEEEEDFEYVRFGYEDSEFFPMERIIELEERGAEEEYYIVTSYVGEGEDKAETDMEGFAYDSHYIIRLLEADKLLLRYVGDDQETEMRFTKASRLP